jgi:CRISPR-associated protein Cmr1
MRTPRIKPPATTRQEVWAREVPVVLITRLFGGGARAREIDKVSWLRSSAVKSALRAWWRAGHAQDFLSLAALREREEGIFGASGTFDAEGRPQKGPGLLEVESRCVQGSAAEEYRESQSSVINYALFPASGMGQLPARLVAPSDRTSSVLTLRSRSSVNEDLEAILDGLRLWLVLGGAGARTRRGVGALAVAEAGRARELGIPTTVAELRTFLKKHCQRREVSSSLAGVFSLARTRKIFLGPLQATGEEAQKRLLTVLRSARQDRETSTTNRWGGRSRWPEADAVRLKAGPRRAWVHSPKPANAGRYPRAALGLPIVVHYKTPPVEPEDHHILAALPGAEKWTKLDRYTSPLILRPVRIWENREVKYVPVAVFTDCTLPNTARPLVVTDPSAEAADADVVPGFDIASEASSTLQRIEDFFVNAPGFKSL